MKRSLLFLVLASLFSSLAAQSPYAVSGGSGLPIDTIINGMEVYLVNGLSGARITFTSPNQGTHQWYRYANNANNAEAISCVQTGNTSYITGNAILQDGYGYFVNSSSQEPPHYIWIIDYSLHPVAFLSINVIANENQCSSLAVSTNVSADQLNYYSPSGALGSLMRNYSLQYTTLAWDDNARQFLTKDVTVNLTSGQIPNVMVPAPLTNTCYTLTGDQYATRFGAQQTIRSSEYQAVAVEAHYATATDKTSADNEIHHAGDILGGSAPITYTFTAYGNDPVAALYIWKISQQDSITGNLTSKVRYTDKVLQYTFDQNGTYVVSLEVSDAQSVCVDTTQTFTVVIDNTLIQIPNAFSPGSSIGVNDELKIAYTSVITFKAYVYNRWGNLLFQWSDPSKGWDGRVNGRFVPTGVYYVVVEYKDSNGKNRIAKQAVNILRSTNQTQ